MTRTADEKGRLRICEIEAFIPETNVLCSDFKEDRSRLRDFTAPRCFLTELEFVVEGFAGLKEMSSILRIVSSRCEVISSLRDVCWSARRDSKVCWDAIVCWRADTSFINAVIPSLNVRFKAESTIVRL